MEIRNLRTFLRVSALKSFTAAGKELGYSQANISAQIKQLEQEVGAPLLNRIGKKVSLTQYGQMLLPYARSIVSTAEQMETLLRSQDSLGGVLRIGMVESLFELLASELLPAYHLQFPRVQVELVVDSTATLKEALRQGTLDLACLIDEPLSPGQWKVLESVETWAVAAVNSAHPLAHRQKIRVEELAGQEHIQMEHTSPYDLQFLHILSRKQIELAPFLTLQSPDMARKLLEKGPYLSILPYYTVAEAVRAGRIAILDIPELDLRQTVQIVLHRDKTPVPQITGFARLAGEQIREVLALEKNHQV